MENATMVNKKRSYYIPIVIGILVLSFIYPFTFVTTYFLAPVTRHFLPDPEQPFIDELKLEENLFPTEPEPSPQIYNGTDHRNMIDNPDYERIMQYNQSQVEKRFEYRRSHPLKENSSIIVGMMYHFAGQVTLFLLIIILSFVHLFFKKNKRKEFLKN